MTTVWFDGGLRDAQDARVGVDDHGLLLGDGVFETFTLVRGVPFAASRHVARLLGAAARLGLPTPDEALVRDAIAAVSAAEPGAGRLRVTWTSGAGPSGPARGTGPGTLLVTASPAVVVGEVRACRSPWVRNERSPLTGTKSTSYQENVVALADARARGADEALLADTTGRLSEGASSNVVVVADGALLTPTLAAGCLPGVTRELLLAWSGELGVEIREADVPFAALDELDGRADAAGGAVRPEALAVTSSLRGLAPVVELDGTALPVPAVLRDVAAAFAARCEDDLDP